MATWRDVMLPGGRHPWHFFSNAADVPALQAAGPAGVAERRQELLAGLLADPPAISPKFLYDEQGCTLYQAICHLDEYYPVRAEAALFSRYREEIIAALPRHAQWVDLGCGDGAKSWSWLGAAGVARYVGVDISEYWLRQALAEARRRHPGLDCLGIVSDFSRPLDLRAVRAASRKHPPVFFYPGSSIGNFAPAEALRFLVSVQEHLGDLGCLLIAVDGEQDVERLVAAYDDALGVTAAFNRNVLRVVNRELGADFRPEAFLHRASFNQEESRMELSLVARETHRVHLGRDSRDFAAGDAIVTEHCFKFSRAGFQALLEVAGFGNIRHWQEPGQDYHVFLAGRRPLS
jgi:dimethylhistidine N-methyltransferase